MHNVCTRTRKVATNWNSRIVTHGQACVSKVASIAIGQLLRVQRVRITRGEALLHDVALRTVGWHACR